MSAAASGAAAAQPSRAVGNYLLSKTIGEGTFGKVKVGVHLLTGERVAVKVLEKDRIVDKGDIRRVTREIKILKHIRHPHIVSLLEVIEKPRHIFLVTEFVSGGELFEFIVAHGRLQETQACHIFRQVLLAVDACHALGVSHRDLKPENILIDEMCNIKVIDFGLSNTFDSPDALLRTACGSPCYAAPEMIAGKRYKGAAADIWSLGVCLFAMLCGFLPFEDPDTSSLYRKIMAGEYTCADFISADAKALIDGMLTTDPARRFTVADIYNDRWFVKRSAAPLVPALSLKPSLLPHLTRITIAEDILDQVLEFGFSREYCEQCLLSRKRNHVTATYYLLQQRKQRELTSGGALGADVIYGDTASDEPVQVHEGSKPAAAPQHAADTKPCGEEGREAACRTPLYSPRAPSRAEKPPTPRSPHDAGDMAPRPPARGPTSRPAPRGGRVITSGGHTDRPSACPSPNICVASYHPGRCGARPASARTGAARRHTKGRAFVEVRPLGAPLLPPGSAATARQARPSTGQGGVVGQAVMDSPRAGGGVASSARAPPSRRPLTSNYEDACGRTGCRPLSAYRQESTRGHTGYGGAPTMTHDSKLSAVALMEEAKRALQTNKVRMLQENAFQLRCEKYAVEFNAEVVAVDSSMDRFVVEFRLIHGDAWLYKELCNRILPTIRIEKQEDASE